MSRLRERFSRWRFERLALRMAKRHLTTHIVEIASFSMGVLEAAPERGWRTYVADGTIEITLKLRKCL